jgi:hypothetical protein
MRGSGPKDAMQALESPHSFPPLRCACADKQPETPGPGTIVAVRPAHEHEHINVYVK